ncbi:MAG: hypothetical protein ACREE4_12640 [Stellaceae bacterium]
MTAETSGGRCARRLGREDGKHFPEIRITVTGSRRRRHFILGPAIQTAALAILLCGALGLGTLGAEWISAPRRVAHQEKAAMRAEIANADLQDTVARLQNRLATTADDRGALKTRLSALAGKAAALRSRLAEAQAKVQAARAAPAAPAAAQSAANPDRIAQLRQAVALAQRGAYRLKAENATLAARINKTEADRAQESTRNRRTEASLVAVQRRRGER